MADQQDPSNHGASGMDYSEHQKTYELFNLLLKWGVIGCVVILLLMLAFCTPS
jgi:Bacterial aa3 type cytochrome c oxidase subunit IV